MITLPVKAAGYVSPDTSSVVDCTVSCSTNCSIQTQITLMCYSITYLGTSVIQARQFNMHVTVQ